MMNGRTMLPLRYVAYATGATVEWSSATQTAIITTGGQNDSGNNTSNLGNGNDTSNSGTVAIEPSPQVTITVTVSGVTHEIPVNGWLEVGRSESLTLLSHLRLSANQRLLPEGYEYFRRISTNPNTQRGYVGIWPAGSVDADLPLTEWQASLRTPEHIALLEREILDAVNADRVERGLAPMIWHEGLAVASRAHARDIIDSSVFTRPGTLDTHTGSDGSSPHARVLRVNPDWTSGSEVIFFPMSPDTETVTWNPWLTSPGHMRVIMSPAAVYAGVGLVDGVVVLKNVMP